jgi:hypothetical protein
VKEKALKEAKRIHDEQARKDLSAFAQFLEQVSSEA